MTQFYRRITIFYKECVNMLKVKNTFNPGWHLVRICDANVITVKDKYQALILELKNKERVQQSFLIFINNWMLVHQLLDASFEEYSENEEIDEKDLIDTILYVNIEEKNNRLVITEIREYAEDEAA